MGLKEGKLLAILRLQKAESIGSILAKKLIATVGDVEQIFFEKKCLNCAVVRSYDVAESKARATCEFLCNFCLDFNTIFFGAKIRFFKSLICAEIWSIF